MLHSAHVQKWWVIALCMFLGACASHPGFGVPRHYAYDNTVSAACRQNSANCPPLAGEAPSAAPGHAVATAGYTVHEALRILHASTRASIEEALKKCADDARSEVLIRYDGYFKGVGPSPEECREWTQDSAGRRVTWAMRLGLEMHEAALKCAAAELARLRPQGFSLEPRYRYDEQTQRNRLVSPEEERALENSGNGGELQGTIKPDVVLHAGDPLQVQAVYDFKFPCVNTDRPPDSRRYPKGHPYQDQTQEEVYELFFGKTPLRIIPRLGIVR